MASLYRKNANWQQLGGDAHPRARGRRQRSRSQGDPHRAGRAARRADEPDRSGDRTLPARAGSRSRTSCRRSSNLERIYAARGQNRELVDVLTRKVPALTEPARDRADQAAHRAALRERASAIRVARRAGLPRGHRGRRGEPPGPPRPDARLRVARRSGRDLVARARERSSTSCTTERERIEAADAARDASGGALPQGGLAAQRLEQVLEIDPNHEEAYFALERSYRKLRQWLELINAYDRHISATLDRKTKVDLYARHRAGLRRRGRGRRAAIDAYKNIVDLDDAERAGARGAREALRQARTTPRSRSTT